jgi:hypothetical protein
MAAARASPWIISKAYLEEKVLTVDGEDGAKLVFDTTHSKASVNMPVAASM